MKAGWEIHQLGELGTAIRERAPVAAKSEYELWSVPSFVSDEPEVVLGSDVGSAKLRVRPSDVLICKINPRINRIWLVREPINGRDQIASTEWLVFRISETAGLLPSWLIHFLSAPKFREWITGEVSGATGSHTRARADAILRQEIPLPPLPQQQRIVRILDKAFERITTAKANSEKNLQNARALFESYLNEVFTQRGEGWVERRLGDVVTRLTNGYVGPTRNIYHESGVPYLLARHVKHNRLRFDGKTFITEDFNRKNKKSMLKTGDVLLVQSGHIGHSAVVTAEHEGHNCHAMIVITPVEGAFIGPFLSLYFNTSGMKQKFQEIRSGSTVPHLTCGEVRELTVAFPNLTTQQRLVDHSLKFEAETQRLEHLNQQKGTALEALKKSLLHEAFAGNL